MSFRFSIPNMLIAILIASVAAAVFSRTLAVMKGENRKTLAYSVANSGKAVDALFGEIDSIAAKLELDKRILQFVVLRRPIPSFLYTLSTLSEQLKPYEIGSEFLHRIHVIFKEPEAILAGDRCSTVPEQYFQLFLAYQGMTFEEWRERAFNPPPTGEIWPTQRIVSDGKEGSYITVVRRYRMSNKRAVMLFLLNTEPVLNSFETQLIKFPQSQWLIIDSMTGEPIISSEYGVWAQLNDRKLVALVTKGTAGTPEPGRSFVTAEWNNRNYTIAFSYSENSRLLYIAVADDAALLRDARYLTALFILTLSTALLFALLVGRYLTRMITRPLHTIVAKVSMWFGEIYTVRTNELRYLERSLDKLMTQNRLLAGQIEGSRAMLRWTFVERLLRGDYNTEAEIAQVGAYSGLFLDGDTYAVVLLKLGTRPLHDPSECYLREIDIIRARVSSLVDEQASSDGQNRAYCHDVGFDRLAVLIVVNERDDGNARRFIHQLVSRVITQIGEDNGVPIFAGIGDARSGRRDIWLSFTEASRAADYRFNKDDVGIAWYAELSTPRHFFSYPIETEQRLINLVRSGCSDEVGEVLAGIFRENFTEKAISVSAQRQLLFEMRGTIARIRNGIDGDESVDREGNASIAELDEVVGDEPMDRRISDVAEDLRQLCAYYDSRKRSHNTKPRDAIIAFIQSNYERADLCRYTIAERFQMTEQYVSNFFREQVGTSITSYVEHIRLEKARELLGKGSMSVSEVARKVGYANANTFYRAFKKTYAVSPKRYRKDTNYDVPA